MSTFPLHPNASFGVNTVPPYVSQNYTYGGGRTFSPPNQNVYSSYGRGIGGSGNNNASAYERDGILYGNMNMTNQSAYCTVVYQTHCNIPASSQDNNSALNTPNVTQSNSCVQTSNAGVVSVGNSYTNANMLGNEQSVIDGSANISVHCANINNVSSAPPGVGGSMDPVSLNSTHAVPHVERNFVDNNCMNADSTLDRVYTDVICNPYNACNSKNIKVGSVSAGGVAGNNYPVNPSSCSTSNNFRYDESTIKPSDVACSFVYQYYCMLHNHPKDLHRFYDVDSQIFRCSDLNAFEEVRGYGQKEINEIFKKCELEGTTSRIRLIQAQECNGGIYVLVTGRLKNIRIDREREFAQTVFLAKQKPPRKGWYVCNETFCYLDAAQKEIDEKNQKDKHNLNVCNNSAQSEESSSANSNANEESANEEIKATYTGSDKICNNDLNGKEEKEKNDSSLLSSSTCVINSVEVEDSKQIEESNKNYESDKNEESNKNEKSATIEIKREIDSVDLSLEEKSKISKLQDSQTLKNKNEKEVISVCSKKKENRWKQKEVAAQNDFNPNWPKIDEVLDEVDINEKLKSSVSLIAENYEPTSYAAKLFKNIDGKQPLHVGYAIPSNLQNAQTSSTGAVKDTGTSQPSKVLKENEGIILTNSNTEKRKIWVSEMPYDMDDAAIKKAVADQLANVNGGHVIEVDRVRNKSYGYLELDCPETVDILFARGLFFRGRAIRIDYVRSAGVGGAKAAGRGENIIHEWSGGRRRGGGRKPPVQNFEDGEEDTSHGSKGWNKERNRKGYNQNSFNAPQYQNVENGRETGEGWMGVSKRKTYSRTDVVGRGRGDLGAKKIPREIGIGGNS